MNLPNQHSFEQLATFCFCLILLILGAAFSFASLFENSNQPRGATFIFAAELAAVVIPTLLYPKRPSTACLLLAGVFLAFAAYHIVNYGKPCGCFSRGSVSNLKMIGANALVGMGLLLMGTTIHRRPNWWHGLWWLGRFSLVVAFSLFLVNLLTSTGKQDDWYQLCRLLRQPNPFLRQTQNTPSFNSGHWNVKVLHSDCVLCMEIAFKELSADQHQLLNQYTNGYFVIFRNPKEVSNWQVGGLNFLKDSKDYIVLPCELTIDNGTIEKCTTVDAL